MPTCARCHTSFPDGTSTCPSDGEALDPLVGTTLAGRYRVVRHLGEGGMGVVYEATHTVIGRTVAVKVLRERHVDRPEVAGRLMNEAKLASSIRNQHIVDIFDFGETSDGRTFVAMELCEGTSFAQVLREGGPLEEKRAARIALQVADALGAAHDAGVIHRDVKPENVFLLPQDGGDFVKVLDFGISKALRGPGTDGEEGVRLTHTGMVLGTPLYMSPEQARGEEGIDHRVDVYALGIILYETLTGELPFSGSNYLSVIAEVQHRPVVRPREMRPDLSTGMERIVLRAMHRDRDARYPSMGALAEDLRHLLAGEPIPTHPDDAPAAPPPAAPRRTGRTALIVAGSLITLAALVAGALYVARTGDASPPPSVAASSPSPAEAAQPSPAQSPSTNAPTPAPTSTVIVKIQSTPPGAAILNGSRKLGVTPQSVELARSDRPVHLAFELPGYAPSGTDIVPQIDGESIEIELKPLPPPERPHRPPAPARARATTGAPEMLPAGNPYR